MYSNNSMAWFDLKTKDNVLDFRIFAQIRTAIGVSALVGLDKLLSLNIVRRLQVRLPYHCFYECSIANMYLLVNCSYIVRR